jgi:hypothetical protein
MEASLWVRVLLPLAAVAALAACRDAEVVNAAPPGITLRVDRDNTAEANARADRYCQQYGKRARLQTIRPSTGSDSIAQYECG